HAARRLDPRDIRLAGNVRRIRNGQRAVADSLERPCSNAPRPHGRRSSELPAEEGDWPAVAVGDGRWPRHIELWSLFHARLPAAVPGPAAGLHDPADDHARNTRLRG